MLAMQGLGRGMLRGASGRPTRRFPVVLNSATSSTAASFSTSAADARQAQKRIEQVQELLQETVRLTLQTGPKGFFRSVQVAEAVLSLAQETLQQGYVDPPEAVLRKLFEKLGATYIKLGQFIASSPSIFPDEYVTEFQKCLDKAEPVPFDAIKQIIREELQQPLEEVFTYIDPKPLATASIAQVHTAILKNSNKEVVIKVLKPGVEDVLQTDLNFIYLMTRYLEFIQPELERLSVTPILGDIRKSMLEEVDFTKEARHIIEFANFLDSRGYRALATTPYVYQQYSSRRILVMEKLVGVPLTDYDAIRSVTTRDPEAVLIAALNTWFASVLGCNSFHADVHAGNLLVLPDGRVGFIDFGIVGRISPVTWKALEALVGAFATADYDTMARALGTIGACSEDVDYPAFAKDLRAFFTELEQVNTNVVLTRDGPGPAASVSASLEVDQAQVNRLFLQLVRVAETHGIKFPREFGLFIKQLLYFDRYTRLLAPELQMLSDDRINIRGLGSQYGI